mgnify:FL=1
MSRIKSNKDKVNLSSVNLLNAVNTATEQKKRAYLRNISTLEAVSPLSVLSRGYSIITDKKNKIVSSSTQLEVDQEINASFKKGEILARVVKKIDEE